MRCNRDNLRGFFSVGKRKTPLPGRIFTLQEHGMRLCIGLPWNDEPEPALKRLGNLAKKR